MEIKKKDRKRLFPILSAALVSMLMMSGYEAGKQYYWPRITIWESHLLTIALTSALAALAAYFVSHRLILANEQLEGYIVERTAELAELNQKLEAEGRVLTMLSRMSEMLQTCQHSDEAGAVIRQFAQQVFPGDRGSVCTISDSRNVVEAAAVWGDPPIETRAFAPEDCWALRLGRLHVVETPTGLLCRHTLPHAQVPSLCIPLTAQGEMLGLLHIESAEGNAKSELRFESKQPLAIAMGSHAALAIANLKLREKLRNQSIRDPLTGLFNRRYMEESLERALRRAARRNRSLSIIMLDLDHFKTFNDTFGHAAGDAVLRALGDLLLTRIRKEDVVCRYGGEEFVVILEEADLEMARRRAEELRESLKSVKAQVQDQLLGTVTASLGISAYPEHGDSADGLLRAAAAALYQAKEEGATGLLCTPVPKTH